MAETTFEKVREIVVSVLNVQPNVVTLNANFRGTRLMADSLDLVHLVVAFAREFGVEMEDEEIQQVETVGDIVNYLERQTA
jgi:acyl carrier protein